MAMSVQTRKARAELGSQSRWGTPASVRAARINLARERLLDVIRQDHEGGVFLPPADAARVIAALHDRSAA